MHNLGFTVTCVLLLSNAANVFPAPPLSARIKPVTLLGPSPPGDPNFSHPQHKLELQTLKLEELTVSLQSPRFLGPLPKLGVCQLSHLEYLGFCPLGDPGGGVPRVPRFSGPQHRVSPPRTQVSELRQQLRLRGLPVSGTKSMLLERMRGGTPSRERSKPSRRDDSPAGGSWPRLRPKALGAGRRSVRAGLRAGGPMRRGDSGMGRSSRRGIPMRREGRG